MSKFHPAIDVVKRLIKEKELRNKDLGSYSYPYGSGMAYECHNCGVISIDDDDIPHKDDCVTKQRHNLKPVNEMQLQLLLELVEDSFEIRRMLCVAQAVIDNAPALPYMDDGEASDSIMWPFIDYIRDSSSEIRAKLNARKTGARTI